MPKVYIKGPIIPNEMKEIYDWFGYDATCPRDIEEAISEAEGEKVELFISSPGGSVFDASDISATLTSYEGEVESTITGLAASAASLFLPLGKCRMHYLALMMVHNASLSCVSGDYHEMDKASQLLQQANDAVSNAYVLKSGKTKDEILEMMDKTTWISAQKALELGLIDEIQGATDDQLNPQNMALLGATIQNGFGTLLTQQQIEKARDEMRRKPEVTPDNMQLKNEARAQLILEDLEYI